MQAKDIKPRTWYALKEEYHFPDLAMLPSTDRYTIDGNTHFGAEKDTRILSCTPDRTISRWSHSSTAYLSVQLFGPARETVQNWALTGEGEEAAQDIMVQAATVLDLVVAAVETRGKVEMSEVNQPENIERGIIVKLVTGRDIEGEYIRNVTQRHENQRLAREQARAANAAQEKRRQRMEAELGRAAALGVSTAPYGRGVRAAWNTDNTNVEMPVDLFAEILDEIERLRGLVAETLRADETGEGDTGARP